MYVLFGVAVFPPIITVSLLTYLNYRYAKKNIIYQKEYMKVRGNRLKQTDEVFNNIRFIKANALEVFFCVKIDQSREAELNWLRYMNYRTTYTIANAWFSFSVIWILLFVCYMLWLGHDISVAKIFTAIAILRPFQDALTSLPNVIGTLFDLIVSSERLTTYLNCVEKKTCKNYYRPESGYDIQLKDISFYWSDSVGAETENTSLKSDKSKKENSDGLNEPLLKLGDCQSVKQEHPVLHFGLKHLNLEIKKGSLVAVIGKSGCGKSSLIYALLNELVYRSDNESEFAVNPNLSIVMQKPWIRNETLRENILMGLPYDHEKFLQVMKLVKLDEDSQNMPKSDLTVVGDKGMTLSGGQRIRVGLARALYQDANLILMDDPLSALDINVGEHIFRETILGHLQAKTRVVTLHNIAYLKYFDKVIFMDNGYIRYFGSYESFTQMQECQELSKIMKETSLLQSQTSDQNNLSDDQSAPKITKNEIREVKNMKPKKQIQSGILPSQAKMTIEQNISDMNNETQSIARKNIETEMKEKSSIDLRLFFSYLKLGRFSVLLFPVLGAIVFMVLTVYRLYFYNQQGSLPPEQFDKVYFLKVLIILEIVFALASTVRGFFCLMFGLDVSRKLNSLIIFRIIHASINSFFNLNPIGKLLNRMSEDMEIVDRSIPISFSFFLTTLSHLLVMFVLLMSLSSPFLIIFVIVYFVIMMKIQRKFTIGFKEVTRMNSTSKSPIFQLFSDSINGLVDIRTARKQAIVVNLMSQNVDFHFKTIVALSGMSQWFKLRITLYSLLFIVPSLVFVVLAQPNFLDGVAIVLTAITNTIERLISFMSNLNTFEKNFVAFDRCQYYLGLDFENGLSQVPTYYDKLKKGTKLQDIYLQERKSIRMAIKNWPGSGKIEFDNVSISYDEKKEMNVLKNISLAIEPKEKIGVIGRTAAGKSTFVISMLRFFDSILGQIKIDDKSIYTIDPKIVRKGITYISQDSYFFEGTLRENLDPFSLTDDAAIIRLLKETDLYEKVELLGGLNWKLSAGGGNLSVGEKQILCFIRAVINLRKIVVMDEATSSLDIKSESLLERMKHLYFSEVTTITIAHRLNTVYQSDKILVLEEGKVKTFSPMNELKGVDLEYFDSYLRQMHV